MILIETAFGGIALTRRLLAVLSPFFLSILVLSFAERPLEAQDIEPIYAGEVVLGPVDAEFDIPQIGGGIVPPSDPPLSGLEAPESALEPSALEAETKLQAEAADNGERTSQSLTSMSSSPTEGDEVLEQSVPARRDPQVDKATGAFTYSVPIKVPAFRGLEPQLAFTYSSSGLLRGRPDSYSGLNWKLSGLSVIERRSVGGGIASFDDLLDVYMLDGSPLLKCAAGQKDASAPAPQIISNYPANYVASTSSASCLAGGNLASKREDYRKIERITATSGNTVGLTGPNGETLFNFKVYNKDGTIYVYKSIGELANLNGTSIAWSDPKFSSIFYRRYLLAEVYDAQRFATGNSKPNRVTYAYGFSSVANGLAERPVEIRYAGQGADNDGGYRILFGYETTADPLSTFGVGNQAMFGSQNRLLRSIRVLRDTSTIRAYKIEYQNGTLVKNTRLASSIAELGGLVTYDSATGSVISASGNVEMPPATFKYNNDVPQVDRVTHQGGPTNTYQFTGYPSFFDFDSDGRSEIAFIESYGNDDSKYPDASSNILQLDPAATAEPKLVRLAEMMINYAGEPDAYVVGFSTASRSTNGEPRYFLWRPTWGPPWDCQPSLYGHHLDGTAAGGVWRMSTGCSTGAISAEIDGDLDPEIVIPDKPWYLNASGTSQSGFEAVGVADPQWLWKDRLLGDFNGNGLSDAWAFGGTEAAPAGSVDFIMFTPQASNRKLTRTVPQYVYKITGSSVYNGYVGRQLASDVNGDGLDDLINVQQRAATVASDGIVVGDIVTDVKVRLSDGYSFQAESIWWSGKVDGGQSFGYFKDHTIAADVNSDGLSDLVVALGATSKTASVRRGFVLVNTGKDFVRQTGMDLIAFIGGGDLNGDGTIDLVGLNGDGVGTDTSIQVVYSKDSDQDGHAVTLANVLTEVKTELGAKVSVQYAPTSEGVGADTVVTDDRIPGVRQVVKSLTLDDGRGGVTETTFSYAGGRWSDEHRESFGFTTVKETLPPEPGDGGILVRTTTFDTINYATAGQVLSETLELDPAGTATNTILSRTLNTWTGTGTGMGPYRSTLSSTRAATWRGDSPTALIETRKGFTYSAYGEVASSTDFGFVSAGNGSDYTEKDNTVSIAEYVPNLSAYIVNKPSHTRVEKVDSALSGRSLWLSAQFFRYDSQAQGVAPTEGNLTWQGLWTGNISNSAAPRPAKAMTYDHWGNVVTELDANNLALPAGSQKPTTYTYGGTGSLFRLTSRSPINPSASFTPDETVVWNENCQAPQSVADQNNQVTFYTYDALCRETQKTLPGGAYQKTEYLGLGNTSNQRIIRTTKSPAGTGIDAKRTMYFDGLGRVYRSQVPGDLVSSNDVTSSIVVLKSYSPRGQVAWQSIPLVTSAITNFAPTTGNSTSFTYDLMGRTTLANQSGGRKKVTEYGFKWLTVHGVSIPHPLVKSRDPNCSDLDTTTVFLKSGAVTDSHGNQIALIRYGANSQITSDDPTAESTTSFGYDLLGRMTSVVDPLEISFAYSYDIYGNRIQANDPGLGIWNMTYDLNGNLLTQTDHVGNVIAFIYDDLNRVTRKDVTTPAGETTRTVSTWGLPSNYSTVPGTNAGHLISIKVSNPSSTTDFIYDHTIDYSYAANGLVASYSHTLRTNSGIMSIPFSNVYAPDDVTLIRQNTAVRTAAITVGNQNPPWQTWAGPNATYDVAGRLVSLSKGSTAADALISTVNYDSWSNAKEVVYGNGATDKTTTDLVRGWIDSVKTYEVNNSGTGIGPLLVSSTYTRTANGKVSAVTAEEASANLNFTYDWFGRLKTVTHPSVPASPAPVLTQTFTYDEADRITNNSLKGAYDYPTSGRPRHAPSLVAGVSLTYDANGNQTRGLGGKYMRYDGENRPISVIMAGTETCYGYGADGTRLVKTTKANTSLANPPVSVCPATLRELYLGATSTLYLGPVEIERVGQADERIQVFAHPNIRITLSTPGSSAWTHTVLHRDAQGSVRAVTGGQSLGPLAGKAVERQIFRPYGTAIPRLSAALPPTGAASKGWIGERYDAEAGLQYLNARYYDPEIDMFLQPDWWEVTEPGVGTNRYSYAGGDPVNGVDPGGHACTPLTGSTFGNFCSRASLYHGFQSLLGDKTNFFGAASMTTQMLANSQGLGSSAFFSDSTSSFLEDVSAKLELKNMESFTSIYLGRFEDENGNVTEIDSYLIRMEQDEVQRLMDGYKRENPEGYELAVSEINDAFASESSLKSFFGSDRLYNSVLATVRTKLGRDIDFSVQSDRELIGHALADEVDAVRSARAPDFSGCDIAGCTWND